MEKPEIIERNGRLVAIIEGGINFSKQLNAAMDFFEENVFEDRR